LAATKGESVLTAKSVHVLHINERDEQSIAYTASARAVELTLCTHIDHDHRGIGEQVRSHLERGGNERQELANTRPPTYTGIV
jgi:hypothetical protein